MVLCDQETHLSSSYKDASFRTFKYINCPSKESKTFRYDFKIRVLKSIFQRGTINTHKMEKKKMTNRIAYIFFSSSIGMSKLIMTCVECTNMFEKLYYAQQCCIGWCMYNTIQEKNILTYSYNVSIVVILCFRKTHVCTDTFIIW